MEKITSTARLKNAIQLLEAEKATDWQLLKEQLYITYKSFKLINLLANTFSKMASSPYLTEKILGTTMGLATGYFSKRLVVGTSVNIFRKLFGSVLQFGVTNVIAHHSDALKAIGWYVIQRFIRKKAIHSKKQ